MRLQVTCPCGCGHTFEVDVPKGTKRFSEEELAKRSERMKAMAGRRKGTKDKKPRKTRSDKGKPRLSSKAKVFVEEHGGIMSVSLDDSKVGKFIEAVRAFKSNPTECPLSTENGGPCDGILVDSEGNMRKCGSMMECYFKHGRYKLYK